MEEPTLTLRWACGQDCCGLVLRSVSAGSPLAASPYGQHAYPSVGTSVCTSSCRLAVCRRRRRRWWSCLSVVEQAGASMCKRCRRNRRRQPVYTAYHVGSARHVLTRSHRMSRRLDNVWCGTRLAASAQGRLPVCPAACLHVCTSVCHGLASFASSASQATGCSQ